MWIAALLLAIDQALKYVALYYIRAWGTNGVYVFEWNTNTPMYSDWLGLLIMAGLVLFLGKRLYIGVIVRKGDQYFEVNRSKFSWVVFLLAGIASNLIDGVHWSAVIDYIRLPWTSFCFNLADVYVLLGIVMLIWGKICSQVRKTGC